MPLQIRRGTNTQRSGILFAEGEIVYTIDTKKLYVGDGSTTGGIAIDSTLNYPVQSGNAGKFLKTDGSTVSWAAVDAFPNQSTNGGKFLTTDGSTVSWASTYPTQTGNNGKVLTTDGSTVSWGTGYPEQSGNNGKFLTTNGSTVSWASVDAFPSQSGNNGKFLTTDGNVASWGNINLSTDPAPSLSANLNINNFNIEGTGDVVLTGPFSQFIAPYVTTPNILIDPGLNIFTNLPALTNQDSLNVYGTIDNGSPPFISIIGSRGDYNASIDTQPNDYLAGLSFKGYANSANLYAAGLLTGWASDADLTKVYPHAKLYFLVGNNTDIFPSAQAVLDGDGHFYANSLQTGSFNGSGNYPPDALPGQIIFDSSDNHFYGFNGTVWKQLDN